MDYLNIDFEGEDPSRTIVAQSFPGTIRTFRTTFKNLFTDQVRLLGKGKWANCLERCKTVAKEYVDTEINSTAYILRCLNMSMLNEKRLKLTFTGTLDDITGMWTLDKSMFTIRNFDGGGRLIMGFGPSASGKTYWANNLINILGKIKPFPDTFMSIDGGTYREASMVYQDIVEITLKNGVDGLKNLIPSGISKSNELFPTSNVKKTIRKYLKTQKKPNLYVPETLGGCASFINCKGKYKPYIELTGDKDWIGVCIWQHKTGGACPFQEKYRCVGCTESGTKREKTEGKKYSSRAWRISYRNGTTIAKEANTWFIIHNTGGKKTGNEYNTSLVESNVEIPKILQKEYNFEVCKEKSCKLKL